MSVSGGAVQVGDGTGTTAIVVPTDIPDCKGVTRVIDKVLVLADP